MNQAIPIKNIYYLLGYAWDRLYSTEYTDLKDEDMPHIEDLLAHTLTGGIRYVIKKGLFRSYKTHNEASNLVKGKVDLSKSVLTGSIQRAVIWNSFDELTEDVLHNQILKATIRSLLKIESLDNRAAEPLFSLLPRFSRVADIRVTDDIFARVTLHRNTQYYRFLLDVCLLIHRNTCISSNSGDTRFLDFTRDEKQMPYIFEAFVRNFYRIEQREFSVKRENIPWDLEADSEGSKMLLPKMETDISLLSPKQKIIIDTKFYKDMFQRHHDSKKLRSNHLYQLISYVSNSKATDRSIPHRGILMYPTVDEDVSADFLQEDKEVSIRTVNLGKEWRNIHSQLLEVINIKTEL